MGFLAPSVSTPALPATPPSAAPATMANAAASGAMQSRRNKAAIGQGYDGTIATSPLGTTAPSTSKSSLLGAS